MVVVFNNSIKESLLNLTLLTLSLPFYFPLLTHELPVWSLVLNNFYFFNLISLS